MEYRIGDLDGEWGYGGTRWDMAWKMQDALLPQQGERAVVSDRIQNWQSQEVFRKSFNLRNAWCLLKRAYPLVNQQFAIEMAIVI